MNDQSAHLGRYLEDFCSVYYIVCLRTNGDKNIFIFKKTSKKIIAIFSLFEKLTLLQRRKLRFYLQVISILRLSTRLCI